MSAERHDLRIERYRGMVDIYRLVSLPRWESDPEKIRSAISKARAVLSCHRQAGGAGEYSQVSGYVTEAERILTDPARKEKYDASLRQAIQQPGEPTVPARDAPRVEEAAGCHLRPSPPNRSAGTQNDVTRDAMITPAAVRRARALPVPLRPSVWEQVTDSLRDLFTNLTSFVIGWWQTLHGGHPFRLILGLTFAVGGLGILAGQLDWSERFPEGSNAAKATGDRTVAARLSPKPHAPSIPGQRISVPRTIPGLEAFVGYAPTLNSTLTAIVFSAEDGDGTHRSFDLFLATRVNPAQPFRKPAKIESCSTPDAEIDPALSPDGLELVFVRKSTSGHTQLMRSYREASTGPFSEPEPVEIPELPSGQSAQLDAPQLLRDGGDLIVRVTQRTPRGATSTYFLAPRTEIDYPFGKAKPLPVFVEQSRHFLTSDGLRSFVARHRTIQVCCRPSHDAPFSAPGKLDMLDSIRIGQVEGPYWVAPAEDFLFYSVTVNERPQQRRRYLRQVRFR